MQHRKAIWAIILLLNIIVLSVEIAGDTHDKVASAPTTESQSFETYAMVYKFNNETYDSDYDDESSRKRLDFVEKAQSLIKLAFAETNYQLKSVAVNALKRGSVIAESTTEIYMNLDQDAMRVDIIQQTLQNTSVAITNDFEVSKVTVLIAKPEVSTQQSTEMATESESDTKSDTNSSSRTTPSNFSTIKIGSVTDRGATGNAGNVTDEAISRTTADSNTTMPSDVTKHKDSQVTTDMNTEMSTMLPGTSSSRSVKTYEMEYKFQDETYLAEYADESSQKRAAFVKRATDSIKSAFAETKYNLKTVIVTKIRSGSVIVDTDTEIYADTQQAALDANEIKKTLENTSFAKSNDFGVSKITEKTSPTSIVNTDLSTRQSTDMTTESRTETTSDTDAPIHTTPSSDDTVKASEITTQQSNENTSPIKESTLSDNSVSDSTSTMHSSTDTTDAHARTETMIESSSISPMVTESSTTPVMDSTATDTVTDSVTGTKAVTDAPSEVMTQETKRVTNDSRTGMSTMLFSTSSSRSYNTYEVVYRFENESFVAEYNDESSQRRSVFVNKAKASINSAFAETKYELKFIQINKLRSGSVFVETKTEIFDDSQINMESGEIKKAFENTNYAKSNDIKILTIIQQVSISSDTMFDSTTQKSLVQKSTMTIDDKSTASFDSSVTERQSKFVTSTSTTDDETHTDTNTATSSATLDATNTSDSSTLKLADITESSLSTSSSSDISESVSPSQSSFLSTIGLSDKSESTRSQSIENTAATADFSRTEQQSSSPTASIFSTETAAAIDDRESTRESDASHLTTPSDLVSTSHSDKSTHVITDSTPLINSSTKSYLETSDSALSMSTASKTDSILSTATELSKETVTSKSNETADSSFTTEQPQSTKSILVSTGSPIVTADASTTHKSTDSATKTDGQTASATFAYVSTKDVTDSKSTMTSDVSASQQQSVSQTASILSTSPATTSDARSSKSYLVEYKFKNEVYDSTYNEINSQKRIEFVQNATNIIKSAFVETNYELSSITVNKLRSGSVVVETSTVIFENSQLSMQAIRIKNAFDNTNIARTNDLSINKITEQVSVGSTIDSKSITSGIKLTTETETLESDPQTILTDLPVTTVETTSADQTLSTISILTTTKKTTTKSTTVTTTTSGKTGNRINMVLKFLKENYIDAYNDLKNSVTAAKVSEYNAEIMKSLKSLNIDVKEIFAKQLRKGSVIYDYDFTTNIPVGNLAQLKVGFIDYFKKNTNYDVEVMKVDFNEITTSATTTRQPETLLLAYWQIGVIVIAALVLVIMLVIIILKCCRNRKPNNVAQSHLPSHENIYRTFDFTPENIQEDLRNSQIYRQNAIPDKYYDSRGYINPIFLQKNEEDIRDYESI